jgi:predicted DNA-binding transcriptional regulator YafY
LFQIVLMLGRGKVLTAQTLGERLEVSERTVYRDVQDLMASGVPIEGEAGVGYCLRSGYQVPPMMFDEDELQALMFGADVARSYGDPAMAAAADRILAKVDAVLPERPRRARERAPSASSGRWRSATGGGSGPWVAGVSCARTFGTSGSTASDSCRFSARASTTCPAVG